MTLETPVLVQSNPLLSVHHTPGFEPGPGSRGPFCGLDGSFQCQVVNPVTEGCGVLSQELRRCSYPHGWSQGTLQGKGLLS